MQAAKRSGLQSLKNHIWWILGAAAVLASLLPYLILGSDSIVEYHDQLDGEMIAYILHARHLFRGDFFPEFMGGMDKTALAMPAPMCVLFFLTGHYFVAYAAMQILGSLTGFCGMYLLGRDISGKKWIGALTGVLYACLPFLPVYGLSQYGIPLLIWCFLKLRRGEKFPACLAYSVLYALNSSLVLVGFAVLAALLAGIALSRGRSRRRPLIAWAVMLTVYIAENIDLLGQIFGGRGTVSHKSEYVLTPQPFLPLLWTAFTEGGEHSQAYHFPILFLSAGLLLLAATGVLQKLIPEEARPSLNKKFRLLAALLGTNLLLALTAAFWDSGAGVSLRSRMAALRGFQLDRVLWMAPALWYTALACALGIGAALTGAVLSALRRERQKLLRLSCLAGAAAAAAVWLTAAVTAGRILQAGSLKPNLHKLLDPGYPMLSYSDYYALDGVMDQVRSYLDQVSGQDVSQYRVVSLGIDPAAAYYQGFYCLDGYSNNYSLDYKHAFRKIIRPELDKSDYLTSYFDDWGNRCYLFSSECPGYYTIEKNGFFFQNYEIDAKSLYGLGGRYLLSAAYIQNGEEQGLSLMREEPFETPDSYYRIFVYEIRPGEAK